MIKLSPTGACNGFLGSLQAIQEGDGRNSGHPEEDERPLVVVCPVAERHLRQYQERGRRHILALPGKLYEAIFGKEGHQREQDG